MLITHPRPLAAPAVLSAQQHPKPRPHPPVPPNIQLGTDTQPTNESHLTRSSRKRLTAASSAATLADTPPPAPACSRHGQHEQPVKEGSQKGGRALCQPSWLAQRATCTVHTLHSMPERDDCCPCPHACTMSSVSMACRLLNSFSRSAANACTGKEGHHARWGKESGNNAAARPAAHPAASTLLQQPQGSGQQHLPGSS